MNKDKNKYEEIILDGEKTEIVIELDKDEFEEIPRIYLDNTIPLDEIVKEITENEQC